MYTDDKADFMRKHPHIFCSGKFLDMMYSFRSAEKEMKALDFCWLRKKKKKNPPLLILSKMKS